MCVCHFTTHLITRKNKLSYNKTRISCTRACLTQMTRHDYTACVMRTTPTLSNRKVVLGLRSESFFFFYRRSLSERAGTCGRGGAHRDSHHPPPLHHVSFLCTDCVC